MLLNNLQSIGGFSLGVRDVGHRHLKIIFYLTLIQQYKICR